MGSSKNFINCFRPRCLDPLSWVRLSHENGRKVSNCFGLFAFHLRFGNTRRTSTKRGRGLKPAFFPFIFHFSLRFALDESCGLAGGWGRLEFVSDMIHIPFGKRQYFCQFSQSNGDFFKDLGLRLSKIIWFRLQQANYICFTSENMLN